MRRTCLQTKQSTTLRTFTVYQIRNEIWDSFIGQIWEMSLFHSTGSITQTTCKQAGISFLCNSKSHGCTASQGWRGGNTSIKAKLISHYHSVIKKLKNTQVNKLIISQLNICTISTILLPSAVFYFCVSLSYIENCRLSKYACRPLIKSLLSLN